MTKTQNSCYLSSQAGQYMTCRVKSVHWTLLGRKKPRPFGRGFVFALTNFPGRPTYCSFRKNVPVAHFRKAKPLTFRLGACVRVTYLPGKANVLSWRRNSPVDCSSHHVSCNKKRTKPKLGSLCSRYLSSRAVTRQVLSAYMSLTSVFGMGTGGPT